MVNKCHRNPVEVEKWMCDLESVAFPAYLQTFLRYRQGGNFTPASSQMQFICHWWKTMCRRWEVYQSPSSLWQVINQQSGALGPKARVGWFTCDFNRSVICNIKLWFLAGLVNLRKALWRFYYCCQPKLLTFSRILFLQNLIFFSEWQDILIWNKLSLYSLVLSSVFAHKPHGERVFLYTGTTFWGNILHENCLYCFMWIIWSNTVRKDLLLFVCFSTSVVYVKPWTN